MLIYLENIRQATPARHETNVRSIDFALFRLFHNEIHRRLLHNAIAAAAKPLGNPRSCGFEFARVVNRPRSALSWRGFQP